MGSYCIGDLSRREILRMSAVLAGAGTLSPAWLAWAESQLRRTPGQVRGPFYPGTNIWTRNLDLTRPRDASGRASGQVLNVTGRVLNVAGEPVRGAQVEIWQANAYGRYRHPGDNNPAPLDPNFDGAAVYTKGAARGRNTQPSRGSRCFLGWPPRAGFSRSGGVTRSSADRER